MLNQVSDKTKEAQVQIASTSRSQSATPSKVPWMRQLQLTQPRSRS